MSGVGGVLHVPADFVQFGEEIGERNLVVPIREVLADLIKVGAVGVAELVQPILATLAQHGAHALLGEIGTECRGAALPQYANSATASLPPTNHTAEVTKAALRSLEAIYRTGYHYKKAGVLLLELVRPEDIPRTLFDQPTTKPAPLMLAFDAINGRFGTGSVRLGSVAAGWSMRQERRSPRYTTRWEDLPVVS